MAPPSILSFYEDLEKNSYLSSSSSSPSSFLLSPCPSAISNNKCTKSPFHSDHDYFIKMNLDNVIQSPATMMTLDDVFGCSRIEHTKEVMTPDESRLPTCCSPPDGDSSKVVDNVFNDVSLVKEQEIPLANDTDFLQGLDDLDFDLDDLDSSRDVSQENNFQNFIDCTLDVTFMDLDDVWSRREEEKEKEEEEDVYKKEFFMKRLGLERVAPQPTQHKSRKRKLDDSERVDFSSYPCTTTTAKSPNNYNELSVNGKFDSNNNNTLFSSTRKIHIVSYKNNNNNNSNSSTNTLSSSSSHDSSVQPTSQSHSVPSKLCSWAVSDWQRSVLYSTAKSPSNATVQTSPSTASMLSWSHRKLYNSTSSLSPSDIFQEGIKETLEFDFLDRGEIDQDTEDLLQWLDNQDMNSSMCVISNDAMSEVCNLTSKSNSSSDDTSLTVVNTKGRLESPPSPGSHQKCFATQDMESFIDLESFVTENSTPIKDTHTDHMTSLKGVVDRKQFSKSQLRLSILGDISNDLEQREYNEKKDAIKRDILKSCRSSHMTHLSNDIAAESPSSLSECSEGSPFPSSPYSSDFSPSASPSSSSSPLSSPSSPPHLEHSKNLDILDLFSDENSSMLLGGSDVSLSSVRFM